MRKEDTPEYLSDEELEALIRETEEGPMIKAPEYLEENILHKIEQQQKVTVYKEKVSAKRKLLIYSMKVMAAAGGGSSRGEGNLPSISDCSSYGGAAEQTGHGNLCGRSKRAGQ